MREIVPAPCCCWSFSWFLRLCVWSLLRPIPEPGGQGRSTRKSFFGFRLMGTATAIALVLPSYPPDDPTPRTFLQWGQMYRYS
jgi:hypothetical protein